MSAHDTQHSVYSIQATKQLVDDYLQDYFVKQLPQARAVSERYELLWKIAAELAGAGGKRIRPYMVLLAYRAFNGNDIDKVLPAAVACELLHIAMLIHDDIIDRDDVRYGVANISGRYLQEYQNLSEQERRHFANSAAILAGDALLAEAHRILSESSDDLIRLRNAQLAFSTAIMHVIGGELIDTEASIRTNHDVHALTIARYKTASYSFIGPLSVGAHLAGAAEPTVHTLKQFADALGIAYQLKDDLLGTFGDSDVTGKSNDTDLKEGKRTYLIEQFDLHATEEDKQSFYALFGSQELSHEQSDQLRQMLVNSGAVEATQKVIDSHVEKAHAELDALHLGPEHRAEFEALITLCIDRDK